MTRDEARNHLRRVCGPGWLPLVDRVFDHLPVGCVVVQVYQKWGVLRFDIWDAPPAVAERLAEVEEISAYTCQICGGTSAGEVAVKGWIETLCADPECLAAAHKLDY